MEQSYGKGCECGANYQVGLDSLLRTAQRRLDVRQNVRGCPLANCLPAGQGCVETAWNSRQTGFALRACDGQRLGVGMYDTMPNRTRLCAVCPRALPFPRRDAT